MLMVEAESASETDGAISTCTVLVVWAFMLSPEALICRVPEVTVAVPVACKVRVETTLPAPVAEKVAGLKDAVTPAGIPATANDTAPENDPPVVVVTWRVAVLPCTTVTLVAAAAEVKVGGASTVRLVVADCVVVPLVPAMAMLAVPRVADDDTETVAVELAPGVTLAGLKLTETPLAAVAFSATGSVYPLLAETATVNVAVLPWTMLRAVEPGFKVSAGAATVTAVVAVPEKLPLVPAMAMLPVPAAAEVVAATVAVALLPGVTLAGVKVTVTPAGAVAFKATEFVKPAAAETATVKVDFWP